MEPSEERPEGARESGPGVDPRLLEILVCPLTKGPLRYDRVRNELVSDKAGLAYPIRDGIPIMLVEEARPLGEDERIPEELRRDTAG
ncbi:MAG: Trm112 family protein [Geminicoccaceae bacterium]|nr:Trm112 family protein [Geminicoccaceae bacterium]MCS7267817.1 Trm112 family protein [Geminicoccaceae bacterium]MCX7630716.1 Trm112 family protein [Geminicoccaceae bacterium]MDW8123644.1 Trm112 family protein [Geminicoccaceae bacterium]MDW8342778.1 Trm112 family protein [Geminicoccaceae bacterium]